MKNSLKVVIIALLSMIGGCAPIPKTIDYFTYVRIVPHDENGEQLKWTNEKVTICFDDENKFPLGRNNSLCYDVAASNAKVGTTIFINSESQSLGLAHVKLWGAHPYYYTFRVEKRPIVTKKGPNDVVYLGAISLHLLPTQQHEEQPKISVFSECTLPKFDAEKTLARLNKKSNTPIGFNCFKIGEVVEAPKEKGGEGLGKMPVMPPHPQYKPFGRGPDAVLRVE